MVDINLRDLADGSIKFSIKARDTDENVAVHAAFKEFCKVECDDNYTAGLRKLLEYYQDDAKYESLWQNIAFLKQEIDELKIQTTKPDSDEEVAAF